MPQVCHKNKSLKAHVLPQLGVSASQLCPFLAVLKVVWILLPNNQSFNQSINQPPNRSIDRSINQSSFNED